MKFLGIDYGRSKIGVSLSEGRIAFPLLVLRVFSLAKTIKDIIKIAKEEGVERIVVGVSEEDMQKEQEKFVDILRKKGGVGVETWDETLTTQDAQTLARTAGLPRKKLRDMEDAFAATVMLQSYLDTYAENEVTGRV